MLVEPRAVLVARSLQLADVRALLALQCLALARYRVLLTLERGASNLVNLLGEDKLRAQRLLRVLVDRGARQREPRLHPFALLVRGVLIDLYRVRARVERVERGAVFPNLLQHRARSLHRDGAEAEAVLGELAPRLRALELRHLDRERDDPGGFAPIALVTRRL